MSKIAESKLAFYGRLFFRSLARAASAATRADREADRRQDKRQDTEYVAAFEADRQGSGCSMAVNGGRGRAGGSKFAGGDRRPLQGGTLPGGGLMKGRSELPC